MENSVINNRYRVLRQIGAGGFGFTYLAEDLGFAHRPRCVVKLLRPNASDAASLALAYDLFRQEAEVLYRLGRHPNIPALIAHFRDRGQFFLVQELIEGHTLDREFAAGKRYNQLETIQLLGQVLEVLAFVHAENVIHRDVKPANIIRRASDGSIALIDFGAVKQVGPIAAESAEAIGSHGYMPIEQLAGKPAFSSDLFALGLVAVECLTGVRPLDLAKDPSSGEFRWQTAGVSQGLSGFISRLIRQNARDRFISAKDALAALNSVAVSMGFFNGPRTAEVTPGAFSDARPEIPATVIVSPQHRLVRPAADAATTPSESEGNAKLARIALGFGALALMFAALHFAGIGSRRAPSAEPRSALTSAEAKTPDAPSVDVFAEAEDQVREALAKERNASTRFEWEEISRNYRRAYLLFSSVGESHPRYEEARQNIERFKLESERAKERAARLD